MCLYGSHWLSLTSEPRYHNGTLWCWIISKILLEGCCQIGLLGQNDLPGASLPCAFAEVKCLFKAAETELVSQNGVYALDWNPEKSHVSLLNGETMAFSLDFYHSYIRGSTVRYFLEFLFSTFKISFETEMENDEQCGWRLERQVVCLFAKHEP